MNRRRRNKRRQKNNASFLICPQCGKSFKSLQQHLAKSAMCNIVPKTSDIVSHPTKSSCSSISTTSNNNNINLSNSATSSTTSPISGTSSSINGTTQHNNNINTNIHHHRQRNCSTSSATSSSTSSSMLLSQQCNIQQKPSSTSNLDVLSNHMSSEHNNNVSDVFLPPIDANDDPSSLQQHDDNDINVFNDVLDSLTTSDGDNQSSTINYYNLDKVSQVMYENTTQDPTFTKRMLLSMKLFKILQKADAPISLYNEIQTFISEIIPVMKKASITSLSNRKELINDLHNVIFTGGTPNSRIKRSLTKSKTPTNVVDNDVDKQQPLTPSDKYPTHDFNLFPIQTTISLSNVNNQKEIPLSIPKFDFISCIVSLLQNPALMQFQNTLYHRDQYLDPINNVNASVQYGDIHTSDWYKDTFIKYKIPPFQQYLSGIDTVSSKSYKHVLICPLIFFIDGIAIDNMGRKSLEPVSFTLGIFNKKTRNTVSAWRVLGYIPNPSKTTSINYSSMKSNEKEVLKKLHYHQILDKIFEDVHSIQKKGGMLFRLPFPGQKSLVPVLIKFPIMYVIGDCLGNDKLCHRRQSYRPTKLMNTGVCRDCNVTFKHCDSHNYKCNRISRKFLRQQLRDVLVRMGFSQIDLNAFDKLDFGGDTDGINGSTPPESLHQWFLGVVKFVIEYFLDKLTTKCKKMLEDIVLTISSNFSRQSDRNMPNIGNFKTGVEKTKLTGAEYGDLLFVMYLSMLPLENKTHLINADNTGQQRYRVYKENHSNGRVRKKRILFDRILNTNSLYNKWLSLFEKMISIGEWLKSDTIPKQDLEDNFETELYSLDGFHDYHDSVCSKVADDNSVIEDTQVEAECYILNSSDSQSNSIEDTNVSFDKNNNPNVDDEEIDEDNIDMIDDLYFQPCSGNDLHEDTFLPIGTSNLSTIQEDVFETDTADVTFPENIIDNDDSIVLQDPSTVPDGNRSSDQQHQTSNNYSNSSTNVSKRIRTTSRSTTSRNNVVSNHGTGVTSPLHYEQEYIQTPSTTTGNTSSSTYKFGDNKLFKIKKKAYMISKAEKGIRDFMKELTSIITGEDRYRLKTVKFHHVLHYPYYIKKYGSASNFDGGVPECIGKETGKHVGKHTQQRDDTMNLQSANRFAENCVVSIGYDIATCSNQYNNKSGFSTYFTNNNKETSQKQQSSSTLSVPHNTTNNVSTNISNNHTITTNTTTARSTNPIDSMNSQEEAKKNVKVSGIKFFVIHSKKAKNSRTTSKVEEMKCIEVLKESTTSNIRSCLPKKESEKKEIVSVLKEMIISLRKDKVIPRNIDMELSLKAISTVTIDNEMILRSTHEFFGDKGWYDWVNIDWAPEDGGTLPAKILMMFDMNDLKKQISKYVQDQQSNNSINNTASSSSGVQHSTSSVEDIKLLIQSVDKRPVNPNNSFTSKLGTMYKMVQNELFILSLDSVKSSCFVLPDLKFHNDITQGDRTYDLEREIALHKCGISSANVISLKDRSGYKELFMT